VAPRRYCPREEPFRHDHTGRERMLSEAEAEVRWAELEQLEDMVRQLTPAASNFQPEWTGATAS
jgi:hypothetical protein